MILQRTNLTPSLKAEFAVTALAGKGEFGKISQVAEQFKVSRETAYQIAAWTKSWLTSFFESEEKRPIRPPVTVDEEQLERTIIAMRAMSPISLRQIEALLPLIYPGTKVSYGKIQGILARAERAAKLFNEKVSLHSIVAGALDEMFSQGKPVLAGVDLDSGFLFSLDLRDGRRGEDWSEVLRDTEKQGLSLEIVVKDAAQGIAKGVSEVFPEAEQRDDCFHAIYKMGQLRSHLERRAYGKIAELEETRMKLKKGYFRGAKKREKLGQLARKLHKNIQKCDRAIDLHDSFERACRRAREAMELIDLTNGELRTPEYIQAEIESAAQEMLALNDFKCRKIGTYLKNRAPGLAMYAKQLREELLQLAQVYGTEEILIASIVWRLSDDLRHNRRPWEHFEQKKHLLGAYGMLSELAGQQKDHLITVVDHFMTHRYRASSAIEGFNAFLRPYLYVHKGVTQGFLELLRAYYNHRTRRWGRMKGTSPLECLTGEEVHNWLDKFYPFMKAVG